MTYGGLIGKIGNDIFNGHGVGNIGVAKYMGTGAVVGGVSGAMLADDGYGVGAFRGALFGAAVGGGINVAPKLISGSFKKHDIRGIQIKDPNALVSDGLTSFKELLTFGQTSKGADATATETVFHSLHKKGATVEDTLDRADRLITQRTGVKTPIKTAENMAALRTKAHIQEKGINAFTKSSSGYLKKDIDHNISVYSNGSRRDKLEIGSSLATKMGFDSAYHHIVEPTGSLINKLKNNPKDINGFEMSAGVFSLYGAYEGYHILDSASNGDIGGVLTGSAMLVGGKLAYGQAVNAIKAKQLIDKYNIPTDYLTQGVLHGYTGIKAGINATAHGKDFKTFVQDTNRMNAFVK